MVYDTDFIGIATKTGSLVVQGVQHDEVQILAVELVFRIHLLVMSLKGKAYEEALTVLRIVLQIA